MINKETAGLQWQSNETLLLAITQLEVDKGKSTTV